MARNRRRARAYILGGAGMFLVALLTGAGVVKSEQASRGIVPTPSGLRIEGRPFFPLGLYYGPVSMKIRDMGFNVVHLWALRDGSTARGLDEAERLGLRAVVELADAYLGEGPYLDTLREHVSAFRSHPAVLVWYLHDEPKPEVLDKVGLGSQLVRSLDSTRPVMTMHNWPRVAGMFAPHVDIVGIDPYPVPNQPLSLVWRYVKDTVRVSGEGKIVWAAIQAFAKKVPDGPTRYPTPIELRNMVYQALVAGASGILYFSYEWDGVLEERDPRLWAALGSVNREVTTLAPVLVDGRPSTGKVRLRLDGDVRSLVREWSGKTYVILVNIGPTEAKVEVQQRQRVEAVESLFDDRWFVPIRGRLTDVLEPYGVRVFVL